MTQVISTPAQTGAPIVPPSLPASPQPKASIFSIIGQGAPAGLVVFLVALPLCLGISLALGAPLLAGVIAGIVGGVLVLGFSFTLRGNAKAGSYLQRANADDGTDNPGAPLHLRLPEHVSSLNKASIVTTLEQLPANSRVILDGTRSDVIDHDVLEAIEAFRQAAPARGIELELRGIRPVSPGTH